MFLPQKIVSVPPYWTIYSHIKVHPMETAFWHMWTRKHFKTYCEKYFALVSLTLPYCKF